MRISAMALILVKCQNVMMLTDTETHGQHVTQDDQPRMHMLVSKSILTATGGSPDSITEKFVLVEYALRVTVMLLSCGTFSLIKKSRVYKPPKSVPMLSEQTSCDPE